jgi:hypothetical protein
MTTEQPKENPPTTPSTALNGPVTYEDALIIIDQAQKETDIANVQAAITKLKAFFTTRVNKKARSEQQDGGAAVKVAMANHRKFEPYGSR